MVFAFFGADNFSIKVLETMKKHGLSPILIVTAPDKPKGRKLILTPPPVKIWAEKNKIPVSQPEKLKDLTLPELDLAVVASYGKILPNSLLKKPTRGFINVHPSLLPKYRGATPLEATILAGDKEAGVTIILVDAELDHGPILAAKVLALKDECLPELSDRLAELGGEMLVEVIPNYLAGNIIPREQNHAKAIYTKKIGKEDGLINLSDNPELNYRKIRAYTPRPGAYFFTAKNGKTTRIIIKKAHLENDKLIIDRVVPEGKKETDYKSFLNSKLNSDN